MIELGTAFDLAVIKAAGADPSKVQEGSLSIDMVPATGPATIRFTMVGTVDSATLRQLIATAASPSPAVTSVASVSAAVKVT